jgi:sugar (pentulose or hexulose) kinase
MEAEVCKRVPREEIYEVTGIQFMWANTIYQLFSEVFRDASRLAIAGRLLFIPDLINYWLTGVKVNEWTIASTSQLLDPRSRTWATSLIERLSMPKEIFGEIVPPGTPLEKLSRHVRTETGAGELVVIAPGCHDTASAVAAVPTQVPSFAYVSSGSWSLMGIESSRPMITETGRDSGFANEGGVCDTFRFLRNINGLWLIEECRRSWLSKGEETSYESLLQAASQARPFSAMIDPNDSLLQTPGDMPSKIAEFCRRTGQPVPPDPGSTIRTILESLALKYRFVLDKLEECVGYRPEPLHIVGGGTRNALLNQYAANAVNRLVITGPVEATSAGNILMQLIANDDLSTLNEGRELILRSFETKSYEPEEVNSWAEAYERFKGIEGNGQNS